jgi:hypothetical protein
MVQVEALVPMVMLEPRSLFGPLPLRVRVFIEREVGTLITTWLSPPVPPPRSEEVVVSAKNMSSLQRIETRTER